MSDYLHFKMQSEIMKRLPVKSLLKFQFVSKQKKSFIDSPKFIKTYHINRTNPPHHLLVRYTSDNVRTYTSIIDDNTFPKQKFPLTEPLSFLNYRLLGCVNGLLCFYQDKSLKTNMFYPRSKPKMVVLWNPSVRKYVRIVIPNVLHSPLGYTRIAFGVCPDTNDPKLVKINVVKIPTTYIEVQVFTLSSRVWKTVYTNALVRACFLLPDHVFINGIIYLSTLGRFILSFDLKSDKFGEVSIPEGLRISALVKVNESLGLLEFHREGFCDVWMRKEGVNQPFTKIYTVKVEGKMVFNTSVLGFRNNGDVVLGIVGDEIKETTVEVYEPSSRHISGVGITGEYITLSATSYMETLPLLDESNFVIH